VPYFCDIHVITCRTLQTPKQTPALPSAIRDLDQPAHLVADDAEPHLPGRFRYPKESSSGSRAAYRRPVSRRGDLDAGLEILERKPACISCILSPDLEVFAHRSQLGLKLS
jgi:hypothetical protein